MSSPDRAVAFRTTCSAAIGFGHLRRCLTLARELSDRGRRCVFRLTGDATGPRLAGASGFEVVSGLEPARFDAVVVDDYAVSAAELAAWHRAGACLAVVDDLADRALDCDLVLNGNANAGTLQYRTPPGCRLLLGPRYAPLRPSFRGFPLRRVGEVRRILVTLGGSDPANATAPVVAQLLEVAPRSAIDVLLGPLHAGAAPPAADRVRLHRDPADVAALMRGADLAVTAGGQTTYELAACGVPAVALCVAENQRGNLAALAAVPTLALARDLEGVGEAVRTLVDDPGLRQSMSAAGQALVDGQGATRFASALEETIRAREIASLT